MDVVRHTEDSDMTHLEHVRACVRVSVCVCVCVAVQYIAVPFCIKEKQWQTHPDTDMLYL